MLYNFKETQQQRLMQFAAVAAAGILLLPSGRAYVDKT
jgi:hypothetical protein